MLEKRIGNSVSASGGAREEVRGSHKKFSGGEGGAKGRVRLLVACGLAELWPATQGFWLGNKKVRSHVVGKDSQERNSWES